MAERFETVAGMAAAGDEGFEMLEDLCAQLEYLRDGLREVAGQCGESDRGKAIAHVLKGVANRLAMLEHESLSKEGAVYAIRDLVMEAQVVR